MTSPSIPERSIGPSPPRSRCPSAPAWSISAPCHLASVSSDPEGRSSGLSSIPIPGPEAAQDVLGRLGGGAVATVSVDFYRLSRLTKRSCWRMLSRLRRERGVGRVPSLRGRPGRRSYGSASHAGILDVRWDRPDPFQCLRRLLSDAGGNFGVSSPSVRNALAEVRRSTNHLAEHPDVAARLFEGANSGQFQRVADYLADTDPQVETLVVTGPTGEILRFFDRADAMNGQVLAVDFYNWSRPVCGS